MHVKDLSRKYLNKPEYRYCVEDVCRGREDITIEEWLDFFREPTLWLKEQGNKVNIKQRMGTSINGDHYAVIDVFFKTRACARAFVKEWSLYFTNYRKFFKASYSIRFNMRVLHIITDEETDEDVRSFFPFVVSDLGKTIETWSQIFILQEGDSPFSDICGKLLYREDDWETSRYKLFFRNERDAVLAKLLYG